jgi:hypothetical protein
LGLFGGVRAVKVSRLAGGPHGFLIAGTRSRGAAVWHSPDAQVFRIEEGAPGLASTARSGTQGFDSVWHDGAWWVIGTATDDAGFVSAMTWTPAGGGTWTRHPVPGGASLATAERAAENAEGAPCGRPRRPRVRGLDPFRRFVVERLDLRPAGPCRARGGVRIRARGRRERGRGELQRRRSLPARGRPVGGAWTDLVAPESVTVNGDHQVTVASGAGRFLLLADDGTRGRVWIATAPG